MGRECKLIISVALGACFLFAFKITAAELSSESRPASVSGSAIVRGSADEAATSLLVFDYPIDSHSILRSGYPMVYMANAEAGRVAKKNTLQIGRKAGLQVIEVPAGRYYVRQMVADDRAFPSAPSPVPTDDRSLLTIPSGVVAYLGDVTWSVDVGLQMRFSKTGLLELQTLTELHDKALMLVGFGAEPRPVSWD